MGSIMHHEELIGRTKFTFLYTVKFHHCFAGWLSELIGLAGMFTAGRNIAKLDGSGTILYDEM